MREMLIVIITELKFKKKNNMMAAYDEKKCTMSD